MTDTVILRAMNNFAHMIMRNMIKDLNDEQVRYSASAIDGRPITGIVLHAYSGAYFMAHAVAGQERPKMPADATTATDLLALLDNMYNQVDQLLVNATDEALEKNYTMPWGQQLKGLEAFGSALAHTLVHAGNIQGIRAIGGFPTPPEHF